MLIPMATRISGAPRSTQIEQDWSSALKDPNRKIPLKLTENLKQKDPEAYALLSSLKPDQLKALKVADTDKSGSLSLTEAKGFLLKNGQLQNGGKFDNFTEALNVLFTKAAGKTIDVRTPNASVLYLQFNNNTDKTASQYNGPRQASERTGLSTAVAKDPDKPELTGLDVTKEFNKGPAQAQKAFRDGMQGYLDNLVKTGGSMTGLVVSGHSNGTNMLFERPHHDGYDANLDIRAELKRFREMENPPGSGTYPYKELFNKTEKVGLLACFQGGNLSEWREIFPNAVLAGTENFSPDAGSAASPAIYGAAQAARQYFEDGGDFKKAEKVGRDAPNARTDGLQGNRGLKISVPMSKAEVLKGAIADFDKAKTEYATASADIEKALRDGKGAVAADRMREIYRIARQYEGAAAALSSAGGKPTGPDGKAVDTALAKRNADRLFDLRF
jgi:hypothetical protein